MEVLHLKIFRRRHNMKAIILIATLLSFSGCMTLAQQAREYRDAVFLAHPEWSENAKQDILRGTIKIGMTQTMVLTAWGSPYNTNRTVGSWGTHEQWVYQFVIYALFETIEYYKYLYFEDGILTAFQD